MKTTVIALVALTLSGCASIMHGSKQDIGISSTPTAAIVRIDGADVGRTPLVIPLARKHSHIVSISADGYQPYETTVTHSTSGWVWGNLAIGGLIGLGVDAISGGMWKLNPEAVSCVMSPITVAGLPGK